MANRISTSKENSKVTLNGVTYFKLQSNYHGDYTKNCSLLANEIDNNFYFLRGYDIENFEYDKENKIITLTRVNGETLSIDISEEIEYPTFEFDKENGKIIITYPDGSIEELDGFFVEGEDVRIASDFTLKGDGRKSNPLRISEVERTGTYKPAKTFIDLTESGNTMPKGEEVGKGYRVVTKERTTPYGCLYDYFGLIKLQESLNETSSSWRVPSREDWAELLNAAEPCEEDRNHDTVEINEWTGKHAGARAKSTNLWKYTSETEDGYPVQGEDNLPSTGSFGTFHVLPVGYGEGSRGPRAQDIDFDIEGLELLSSYWTLTPTGSRFKSNIPNVFTRTFAFDTRKVLQESSKPSSRLSVRLVKDFEFDSFNEYENILGHPVPCVLICNPETNYSKIWTSVNIGFTEEQYSGVTCEDWYTMGDDEDREFKDVYYINEWNGYEWVKKPMIPGDSVVIIDYDNDPSTSGDTYHEWRVYLNEDGTVILKDTVEALKEEIQEEIDDINERIDELSAVTEEEINRAYSAETILAEAIDGLEIVEVEPNSTGVKKAYQLHDVNGNTKGVTIEIPFNTSIKTITTGWTGATIDENTGEWTYWPESGDTEVLYVIYLNNIGKYELVSVDLEEFIREDEFKDGLEVIGNVVKVKIDTNSDEFLTVSPNGILLSGVSSIIGNIEEQVNELSAATEEEIERAIAAENSISAIVFQNEYVVSKALNELNNNINSEIDRAITAENSISGNVRTLSGIVETFSASTVAEIARLDEKVDNEIERAVNTEEIISGNVTDFSASTVAEIARLDGQDVAETGHEVTLTDGITLKRNNGEEIKINIDTNFGLLPIYE